ncbi:MAG: aromatic ring-hydroxylating dioxygenase subunit alpha [bacterium]|nr:aromatic ring-hydroxylating dioxygenase subunit alpha [Gammaproteobacteria bacterium]
MSKAQLIEMARHGIEHGKAGTIDQTADVLKVPANNYYDESRWRQEVNKVFRHLPLMLAMTAELKSVRDYKAMTAGNVPVLITRTEQGIKAYLNMCSHRGAQIMEDGRGNSERFTCPYHAWSYNQDGELYGILSNKDFGDIDKSCYGLISLPCLEKAGLIWVITDPKSTVDINAFLSGYDALLALFGFENWYYFDSRKIAGPNWKIAYDGYLDLYHLPILHKDTFGSDYPNKALYYPFGPHQRVSGPDHTLAKYEGKDEDEWPTDVLMNGVWTIFPHVSIASFDNGGRGVLISQLFPGEHPGESYTIQNYMLENEPDEERARAATEQFEFLKYVVQEEDYATGLKQQRNLETGVKDHVLFGRNEGGGHNFHRWVDTILETDCADLNKLFETG